MNDPKLKSSFWKSVARDAELAFYVNGQYSALTHHPVFRS